MPQTNTHYSESYLKTVLSTAPWNQGTRRVSAHLLDGYTAWTPRSGVVEGPAVVTWIQNLDKTIDAVITQ